MDNVYATQDIQPQLVDGCGISYSDQEVGEVAKLVEQHAKFANARELVLHDINASLQSILDLKTHLNTLTVVGRLSDELIAKILTIFVDELYYSESALRDYACYYHHQPPQWLKLTHVCRRWRNVALQTTQLWSHVYLSRSDAFAKFVERSKATPLDIDVHDDDCSSTHGGISVINLIPPLSSRIRFLSIDEQISTVQAFCKQLTQPLGQLEKLVLASRLPCFGLFGPPPAVPIVATAGLTPRLRHLKLDRIPFRWTDPAFCSSLTTLKVISPTREAILWDASRPDIGTTPDLLDVLTRVAPHLEALHLDGSIPTPANQNPGALSSARTISFPSLRSLRLSGPTYDCADLLSHFSMNREAGVHLTGRGSKGIENLLRMLYAHLTKGPLVAIRWGSLYGNYDINIYGWQTADMSGEWDQAPVRLAFSGIYGDEKRDTMQTFIREISPILSHVESMKVDRGLLYGSDLFASTPRLRTLAFVDDLTSAGLFDALTDVRTSTASSSSEGQSVGMLPLRLPELRAVHFNEVAFRCVPPDGGSESDSYDEDEDEEPVFIDDLLAWVALRSERGVPPETLELRNCKHAEERDVEGLRRFVPNVVWDGSGIGRPRSPTARR